MAMFEQALSMWSPFGPTPGKKPDGSDAEQPSTAAAPAAKSSDEINELKAQLAAMQQKIEKLTESRD